DAYDPAIDRVIDCKAWSSWQKVDYICGFLLPQLIVQRACVGAKSASILLVHGGTEPQEYPLGWDAAYEEQVWERIHWLWRHVEALTPPYEKVASVAPDFRHAIKEYDYSKSNEWGYHATEWLMHRDSAKRFNAANSQLKTLVPEDAKRCFGHGIQIKRSKAGSLTISETE